MTLLNRTFGAFLIAAGLALGVGGWIYAGWPKSAVDLVSCALVQGAWVAMIVLGAFLWTDSRR